METVGGAWIAIPVRGIACVALGEALRLLSVSTTEPLTVPLAGSTRAYSSRKSCLASTLPTPAPFLTPAKWPDCFHAVDALAIDLCRVEAKVTHICNGKSASLRKS